MFPIDTTLSERINFKSIQSSPNRFAFSPFNRGCLFLKASRANSIKLLSLRNVTIIIQAYVINISNSYYRQNIYVYTWRRLVVPIM